MSGRFVQTTVCDENTDNPMSAVFVPKVPFDVRDELGTRNLIELPSDEFSSGDRPYRYIDAEWLQRNFFRDDRDATLAGLAYLDDFCQRDSIIIEQSPPLLTSLSSFLLHASGVSIGTYVGIESAASLENPLLMYITIPAGMLIVGTAKGVGTALETGLRDRLVKFLGGRPQTPAPRGKPRAGSAVPRQVTPSARPRGQPAP